jgi:hypothetical protein
VLQPRTDLLRPIESQAVSVSCINPLQVKPMEGYMRKVAALFGSMALVMGAAASADDQDGGSRMLKGRYALTGASGCVFSSASLIPVYVPPAGFTPTFVPIGHASANSFSRNGVLTFNENGTGTSATRVIAIGDPDPGDSGATSAIDSSSAFTYSVADGGALTLVEGPITSTFVAGPRAGIQTLITNVPALVGYVSKDKKTLVLSSFEPAVESTTRLDLGLVESVRICHRSTTAVRIEGDG